MEGQRERWKDRERDGRIEREMKGQRERWKDREMKGQADTDHCHNPVLESGALLAGGGRPHNS